MRKQTAKVRYPILVLALSLWILNGSYQLFAQQIKWLRTGELQSFVSEIGAECELQLTSPNPNYFSWPAKYGIDQSTARMQSVWIGCKNFYDPVEAKTKTVKVIGAGPRDFADRVNQIFPQEFKLLGKTFHPAVTVDGISASILDTYDSLDVVDAN